MVKKCQNIVNVVCERPLNKMLSTENIYKSDLELIDSKIAHGPKPATISGSFHKKSPQQDFLRLTLTAAGPRDSSAC